MGVRLRLFGCRVHSSHIRNGKTVDLESLFVIQVKFSFKTFSSSLSPAKQECSKRGYNLATIMCPKKKPKTL